MNASEMVKLYNKTITLFDQRTKVSYAAKILDVKSGWGQTRIQVTPEGPWFEPTSKELASITD